MASPVSVSDLLSYFAAFSAGVAAVFAFVDKRDRALKLSIETEMKPQILELKKRIEALEGRQVQVRSIAVEGVMRTADESAKARFVRIVEVLD
ncbi:hypothetical protein [Fimbriimonas ginsengisoli]|uniref:Uncharacterized protein n=1 Tax=Fimbriimonas ginsengisoli Gsoil 348 TaxID=661478 RepID=A0A068NU56_FIMGI|nr:hypothetical protein [Fimbriimonas ginsengisoli]AIE86976.1 hypothetical protein OP10G_3608 [Fimbriimonas ginsengisoli Gsoil 348]